jgi:hypothetical protein
VARRVAIGPAEIMTPASEIGLHLKLCRCPALVNTAIGYALALTGHLIVFPMFGIDRCCACPTSGQSSKIFSRTKSSLTFSKRERAICSSLVVGSFDYGVGANYCFHHT